MQGLQNDEKSMFPTKHKWFGIHIQKKEYIIPALPTHPIPPNATDLYIPYIYGKVDSIDIISGYFPVAQLFTFSLRNCKWELSKIQYETENHEKRISRNPYGLQEISAVLEAGLEPAQPSLAKGF